MRIFEDNRMQKVSTIYYDELRRFENMTEVFHWQRQVFKEDNTWNNAPTKDGMVISPYLKMQINGKRIPVYAARATFSTHSFAYAEVESETDIFSLDIELECSQKRNHVVVLPESRRITPEIVGDTTVKCTINTYGTYTFVFDHYVEGAVTLMVRKQEKSEIPDDYDTVSLFPAKYLSEGMTLKAKTAYRFERGVHYVDCVTIPSDCIVELAEGAVLKAYAASEHCIFRTEKGAKNIKICGKGALDCSELESGSCMPFNIVGTDGITVKDLTIINSPGWTVCFTNCNNVKVKGMLLIGYRIWSDGVMLSDCTNSIVSDCFIRTGDDAAECKSTGDGSTRTDNIVFKNIDCWMDKAVAYGIVFEASYDTRNVRFENCSVGFAFPNWSDHLGCITVFLGDNPAAVDYDIFFKNIEIYYTLCPAINLCAYEGSMRDIYVENLSVKHCFHEAPVFFWVRDAKKAAIGNVYMDNIDIGGKRLKSTKQTDLIKFRIPEELQYDPKTVFINSKNKHKGERA